MEAEERGATDEALETETVVDAEVVEDPPPSEEEAAATVAADIDELTSTRKERDEYLDLAQRTKADFENFRKRAAREAEDARLRGHAELAARLIPAIDNLERALEAAGSDPTELAKGVGMVHADLGEALKGAGVEGYDPTGEPFDPAWHEALSTVPSEGAEPGVVIETLARGYRISDQVLRPARVVVSE